MHGGQGGPCPERWRGRWAEELARGVATVDVTRMTRRRFEDEVSAARVPVVLAGLDAGRCCSCWSAEQLAAHPSSADTTVSVHVCAEPDGNMAFAPHRNFSFHTMSLRELVQRAAGGGNWQPLVAPGERYYLRSVGANPRKEPSQLPDAFPGLAPDVKLPQQLLPEEGHFSSVLRVSSGGLQLWTHYDVMDNILLQVTGTKRVVLWPPCEEGNLYVQGSSSEVVHVDSPADAQRYPLYGAARRLEVSLGPGDALFIPALWFHNVRSNEFGVSVNVFWRHLQPGAYQRKDLYGNRDLVPAAAASKAVEEAVQQLQQLPSYYSQFYADRLVRHMQHVFNL